MGIWQEMIQIVMSITLARLCSPDTIAYVQCTDTQDEHYKALHQMEEQLKTFRTLNGNPYRLLALPMVDKIEKRVNVSRNVCQFLDNE